MKPSMQIVKELIESAEQLNLPIQMTEEEVKKLTRWIATLAVNAYEKGYSDGKKVK